ncbi:hypothetical protein J6590_012965 [Homalodisca vitripennis]|nr:hypothetical protein J6590_012965 [Homalodisca vitripennis]
MCLCVSWPLAKVPPPLWHMCTGLNTDVTDTTCLAFYPELQLSRYQCLLQSPVSVSVVDSDEGEPVHKYPRLSCSCHGISVCYRALCLRACTQVPTFELQLLRYQCLLQSPVSVSVVDSEEGEPVHKYPRLSCSCHGISVCYRALCLRACTQVPTFELQLLRYQCLLQSPVSVSVVDSDEGEPVHKYPRLSCSPWPDQHSTTEFHDVDGDYVMDVSSAGEMVGSQSDLNLSLPPSSCKSPSHSSLINRSGSMQIPAEEDVINENFPFHKSSGFDSHTRRQSEPARKLFPDETSFTRSERPARNYATFYSKHPDTESEREEGLMETDTKNSDVSSEEDEWTYKPGVDGEDSPVLNDDSSLCHSTETLSSVPKSVKPQVEPLTKPKLKKLIEGAEVIAHSSPTRSQRNFLPLIFDSTRSKSKVSDWMRLGWDPEDGKTQH